RDLAGRFARLPVNRVIFEILNEPEFEDRYRWSGVQAKLLAGVRQATPRHTAIVSGHRSANIEELLSLEPVRDANVIYNFHFYLPQIFTHQGAAWGRPFWRHIAAVAYPSSADDAGDFGLVTKQSGQIVVDEPIVSALGLGSDATR